MTPFPWAEAMGFGLGVLRLAPRDFWSMSPRELSAAFDALHGRRRGLGPDGLAVLMAKFPDQDTRSDGGSSFHG